jgi:multidrug transporter EmrE-like cation transporter
MGAFKWTSLGFGILLSLVDVIAFPIVRYVSLGSNPYLMILPVLLYGMSPFILLQSLKMEGLAVMNLLWDTLSTITITFICIAFFKEKLTFAKITGMVLSIISITLLTYET